MLKRSELFYYILPQISDIYPYSESISIAKVLIEYVFCERFDKIFLDNSFVDDHVLDEFNNFILRLSRFEPIQYLTGEAFFYGRKFVVSDNVLIPRSETEELVKRVLLDCSVELTVSSSHCVLPSSKQLQLLDIGTGSGCIAITMAKENYSFDVFALDVSDEALTIAKKNAESLGASVVFINDNIFNPSTILKHNFDIIVSNPPYVTMSEKSSMRKNVTDYEPDIALYVDDNNPLSFYKQIIHLSEKILNNKGRIYFEINERFGNEVAELLLRNGYRNVKIYKDLYEKDRIVCGIKK